MLASRTPPWKAICFTQTGQRYGELTANYDQVDAQKHGHRGLRRQWISPPLRAPFECLLRNISPSMVAVFWQCLSSARIDSALLKDAPESVV